jgi:hypothetical protein
MKNGSDPEIQVKVPPVEAEVIDSIQRIACPKSRRLVLLWIVRILHPVKGWRNRLGDVQMAREQTLGEEVVRRILRIVPAIRQAKRR